MFYARFPSSQGLYCLFVTLIFTRKVIWKFMPMFLQSPVNQLIRFFSSHVPLSDTSWQVAEKLFSGSEDEHIIILCEWEKLQQQNLQVPHQKCMTNSLTNGVNIPADKSGNGMEYILCQFLGVQFFLKIFGWWEKGTICSMFSKTTMHIFQFSQKIKNHLLARQLL